MEADDPTPFYIQADITLKTNFFATRNVCIELLPIIKPHGKSNHVDCQVVSLDKKWAVGLSFRSDLGMPFLCVGDTENCTVFS